MKKILTTLVIMLTLGIVGKIAFAADAVKPAGDDKMSKLYQGKCASCHGKDGKGNPSMAKVFKVEPVALDLTTKAVFEKKNEELDAITAEGKGKMPAYKGKLTPAEISGLTAYIKTLAPK